MLGKEERNKDFMQNLYEDKDGQVIGLDDLNAQKTEQGQQHDESLDDVTGTSEADDMRTQESIKNH